MRNAFRLLLSVFAMAGTASTSLAQKTTDHKVKVRISPDLDKAQPELRKAVEESGAGVVAEPAEFEIGSDRYLTDFTEMRPLAASTDLYRAESVIRIGKLSSGNVPKVLSGVLGLMARQKSLQSLSDRPVPQVSFCKADFLKPDQCMAPEMAATMGQESGSLVRNTGDKPRYVALLQTSADLGINLVPITATGSVARVDPGKTLRIPPHSESRRGRLQEHLIVSDQPFDATAFTQPSPFKAKAGCYGQIHADCIMAMPDMPIDPKMAALSFTSFQGDEPEPAMGGGFTAARGDADWMVAIYSTLPYTQQEIDADKLLPPDKRQYLAERTPDERAHSCGGTMIAPDLVLTAAHCVATGRFRKPNVERIFDDRRVRIGSLRLGKGGETRAIVGVAIHAGYTGEKSGIPYDIALLLVKSDDRIRLSPRPLDLAVKGEPAGATVTGLGWGYTQSVAPNANLLRSTSDELQRNPNMLQQAPLELLALPQCAKRMPGRIKPGMICLVTPKAVAASGGRATFSCRGDSGGPLVRNYGQNGDELIGLTSFSLGCGYKDTPSVYTDVAYFAKWIAAARAEIKAGKVSWVADPAHR